MPTPIRLLLLEDTPADAELIMRELKRAALNVTVRRVDTEREFRQHLTESFVDIILADYSLPSFDGEAALEIAHELVPEIPFIFVSGSIGEERAIAALHNGATDYILKDRLSRLGPAVKRALDERKQLNLRRAAQEALRVSAQRFEYATRATSDALWDWDLSTGQIWIGEAMETLTGISAADQQDVQWWFANAVHPHDARRVQESLQRAIDSGEQRWSDDYRLRKADGSYAYVAGRAHVIHDGRGVAVRVVGAVKDITERRRAEQELRESEARFRSVAESAADAILLTESDCTIIFANERAAAMFDVPAADLVGQDTEKLLAERVRPEIDGALNALLSIDSNEPKSLTTTTLGRRRDGTEFPIEISVSTWKREGRTFLTKILRDVSARVAAEEARLVALERLREAQQLAHVGSWEHDLVTGAVAWSEEVYAIFGVDPASFEPTFETYVAAIHPLDRDRVAGILSAQQREQQPETTHFQHRIERPDGSERTVECRSHVVLGENGATIRAIGTVQDITEQAEAARTIEELSLRSETILDCAGEGIIGVRHDASIMFVNPAALSILGRSREELGDCRDTHELFHHTKADGTPYPASECPVLMTLADGKKRTVTGEFFWRRDGSNFAVEYESAPIFENGAIKGCVMTFRDVTESQALQRQLDLARRIGSLGRVAATIAHEFNNVLMGINPFAELIQRRARSDEKIVKAAEQIAISVRRGRRVTEEILRFTQPAEPDLQTINVREWIRNLEPELHALAGADTRVTVLVPDNPVYAACDAAQLQQVIANLLLNARDASPAGGEVLIALETRPDGFLEIIVRDNGPGIPPQAMESIFEPLFTTKRTGTGLGLSVVRQIVTRHGGTISVTNPAGGGAEFRILIPASDPVPAADSPAAEVRTENTFRRLLIVEDDESVADGLAAVLAMEGLVVQVADRGEDALEAIVSFRPDAVILDLTLPDIDGTEVFRLLRERWPKLPVVFSTGHGGEIELGHALESGRVALIRKPYNIDELLSALRRVRGSATEAA